MNTTRWPSSATDRNAANSVRVRGARLLLAWVKFLGHIPWSLFVTLTFDPKRVFPVDRVRAGREAAAWCGHIGWMLRRPIGWLIALERGASGQWHAHVLLIGVPRDISALARIWRSRNGRVDVRPVNDAVRAVLYTTKEAALSGEVVLSDTLGRYRERLTTKPRASLYPGADEESLDR